MLKITDFLNTECFKICSLSSLSSVKYRLSAYPYYEYIVLQILGMPLRFLFPSSQTFYIVLSLEYDFLLHFLVRLLIIFTKK